MATDIADHAREALTAHLRANGVAAAGAEFIFVVAANETHPFEVFYSWVKFPAVDGTTGFFHNYRAAAAPARYEPHHTLEVPLTAWQHTVWFNGALPNVFTPVRMDPFLIPGATWPVLAGYAPHPRTITTATLDQLRVLHTSLITVH